MFTGTFRPVFHHLSGYGGLDRLTHKNYHHSELPLRIITEKMHRRIKTFSSPPTHIYSTLYEKKNAQKMFIE